MSFAKQVAVKQTAAIIAINFVLIIHFYLIINILICLKSCISQLYFVYLRHGRQGNDQHINRPATVKG